MAEIKAAPAWQVERVPTGVPGLDQVIDGGLTRGGMALIVGGPGVGKTVLAEQIAFHWGAQGRRVLWVVTPGEPNEKLLTHLSEMRFFDRALVGQSVQLINLSRYLEEGPEAQLQVIRDTLQGADYAFVIIDGFQTLRCFLGGEREVRRYLSELSSELALMGITFIVTVDASPVRYWEAAEFTMADAIIDLMRAAVDGRERRQLQVLKQRGRPAIGGPHAFTIDGDGLHVYPRLESMPAAPEAAATTRRQHFGLAGLDQMLAGGLLEGSTTLLAGSPGTGKTLLAGQFLAAGLRQGQPGLYLGFFETLSRFLEQGDEFGMALRAAYESGLLHARLYPAGRCEPDACVHDALQLIAQRGVRRLVLDGLNPLERELRPGRRVVDFMSALAGHLCARGVTAVFTRQIPEGAGLSAGAHPLVSQITDNAILLRLSRLGTRHRRLLSIVKTRYSEHSPAIAEFLLAEGRLDVITDPAVVKPEPPDLVPIALRDEPQAGHYF